MVNSLAGLHRRVESHLHCPGCDYDLFGLRLGGKCPECGTPIRPSTSTSRSINDVPIADLKRLRDAIFYLFPCVGSIPLVILALFFPASAGTHTVLMALGLILFIAVLPSASWFYGVFVLTAPLPGRHDLPADSLDNTLRYATRGLSLSWLFALGIPLAWRLGVHVSPLALYLLWLIGAIGTGIGFALLATSVSRLAAWANDPDLGHHLRGAAVAVAFLLLGLIILTALAVMGANAGILLFFYIAGIAIGLGLAGWNIVLYLRLAALFAWAPINARAAIDRARARDQRITQRMADAESKPEPVPHFNVIKPPVHGVYIEQTRDAAIDLAPADTPPAHAPNTFNQSAALPPLPKRRPSPPDSAVNRRKDEMI